MSDQATGQARQARQAPCTEPSPPWFVGHWREWHRGHGCGQDDGKPRAAAAEHEIQQHTANKATGYLTDAELGFLRNSTTSGNTMLVRALDELRQRRTQMATLLPLFGRYPEDRQALLTLREQLAWRTIDVEAARTAFIPVLDRLLDPEGRQGPQDPKSPKGTP